jgi:hypothetical protein
VPPPPLLSSGNKRPVGAVEADVGCAVREAPRVAEYVGLSLPVDRLEVGVEHADVRGYSAKAVSVGSLFTP